MYGIRRDKKKKRKNVWYYSKVLWSLMCSLAFRCIIHSALKSVSFSSKLTSCGILNDGWGVNIFYIRNNGDFNTNTEML